MTSVRADPTRTFRVWRSRKHHHTLDLLKQSWAKASIDAIDRDRIPILVKAGSIMRLGPVIQSAAEHQDPLDIRIYGGKDASFELYEDSGDGYAYEHAAKTTIHFQWDGRQRMLSIGNRSGSFPGMLAKRTFRIVLVKPGHGVGDESNSMADRSVTYDGGSLKIDLGKKS